ncbi:MAG: oligosaccharide repeat unit polymerase [Bacteroidetes bacterium]|nr:oligosaccharide repeat unit polymerase [Bacteroidota bacterium]
MLVISFICFLILAIVIISFFFKNADIFSPSRVFIAIWAFAIGLADLKFSRFQHPWSSYGWMTLLISIASFLLGSFAVYVSYYKKKLLSVQEIRVIISNSKLDKKKFFLLILLLFSAYIISYTVVILIVGFVPLLSNHPSELRTQMDVFGFGLIVHSSTSIMYFVLLYLLLIKQDYSKKIILTIIFLITFATYFALLQRYDLIFWLIISLVFYYYFRKINFKTVLFFSVGLTSIIYAIQNIRMSKYFTGYIYIFSKMKFSPKYAVFTEPYMYVVMNLENFTKAVTKVMNYTYGYYTFNFVLSLSGLKHWIKDYANLNDTPFLNSGYNTYTMFWDFYRDFGLLGLTIISFGLGFLVSTQYYNFRINPTIHSLSLYAICVFLILFSFFINPIGQLHFFFNTCLIFIFTLIASQRNNRANYESTN